MNGKKLALLCSAAIGVMYSAGYVLTAPAAHAQNALAASSSTVQTSTQSGSSQAASSNKVFKDGTYYGTGSNRIGSVQVAVTFQNDQIKNVKIVQCTTSYPEYLIAGLPAQVVANQSYQVNNVSGASESTRDFETAVYQAMAQAKI